MGPGAVNLDIPNVDIRNRRQVNHVSHFKSD